MQTYRKALKIVMKSPVTDDMVQFLTRSTLKVLPQQNYPTPPTSPVGNNVGPHCNNNIRLPSLRTFITRLVRYTNVYTQTLLTTVCYLNKLQRILPKDAKGLPSTIHRLFLACLILSAKFHNDSSPLNKHWAKYTDGLFTLEDINLMERQLLNLLQWDLRINENDLILDLQDLLNPIVDHIQRAQLNIKKNNSTIYSSSNNSKNQLYEHDRNSSNMSNMSIASNLSNITLVNQSTQNLSNLAKRNSPLQMNKMEQQQKIPQNLIQNSYQNIPQQIPQY